MDFLAQQNQLNRGININENERITATGKSVIVIGGGDTGSDCVGTSVRQQAKSIMQIEIMPKPSEKRNTDNPWPYWANVLRYSSSHEEGCERKWSLATKKFLGEKGVVKQIDTVEVEWQNSNGKLSMSEKPLSTQLFEADLVLLAMGFVHCEHAGLVDEFNLELDSRGNIKVNADFQTNHPNIFAAGDSVTGASLVVRAISHGRKLALAVDKYLKNN
jgi:glutamate synthase (NADPH/NADH) small chain